MKRAYASGFTVTWWCPECEVKHESPADGLDREYVPCDCCDADVFIEGSCPVTGETFKIVL